MRLTLRTMLAYLDEILDPEDANILGKKIDESDFAANLVHRIRNATRRLRLGAPNVQGKGIGADANTVAEYLDNTLQQERVPEYEKTCLESDVYLAEAASCHQILTMVLGEPADVEPAMRRRMYRLQRAATHIAPDETAEKEVAPVQETETKVEPEPKPELKRAKPLPPTPPAKEEATDDGREMDPPTPREVPDYLRPGTRARFVPLAVTLCLAFLVAIVSLKAMGDFNRSHPLYRLFGADIEVAEVDEDPDDLADGSQIVEETIGDGLPQVENPPVVEPAEISMPIKRPITVPADFPLNPPVEPDPAAEVVNEPNEPRPVPPKVEPVVDPLPAKPVPPEPPPKEPVEVVKPVEATDVEVVVKEVGRLISEDEVLIRHSKEEDSWLRLPARATLRTGDRLLVLPTFRPQILLSPATQVALSGPTAITLQSDAGTGIPQLDVSYGRFVVAKVGEMEATVILRIGNRVGAIRLENADSVAAIEVRNFLPPGSDPETTIASKVVEIFASGGAVEWKDIIREGAAEPTLIEAEQVGAFVGDKPINISDFETLPLWTSGNDISDIDQLASPELAAAIVPGRSTRLTLQENMGHRKAEIRALATRCLSYFDEFEAFFALDGVLRDEFQRASWIVHFTALQQAVARGKLSAEAVRVSLEKHRPDDAKSLYRLIWGFSPEQLEGGGDLQLVQWLEHEAMDYRVLSYANLERITTWTLGYLPHYAEGRRKSRVAEWRRRLDAREIKYKVAPTARFGQPALEPAP